MSGKLFWYTRKEESPLQIEGQEKKYIYYKDAISLDKVIRAIALEQGNLLILLDDIHQRPQEVPVKNKQGKITSIRREVNTFQSEITIEKDDADRFYNLTNIDYETTT